MNTSIDLRIVGQLVSAISVLHVYPDEQRLMEFLEPLLADIPGCLFASLCFRGSTSARSSGEKLCLQCPGQEGLSPGVRYPCLLAEKENYRVYPLETMIQTYGYLAIMVVDPAEYTTYEPFVHNLGNILAITLENRRHVKDLKDARESLEQRVAERTEALHSSEQRWLLALEGIGDGLWDWNAQTNEVYFSPEWKAMLGYGDDEIGNTLEEWSSRIHPEDEKQCFNDLERHIRKETPFYRNEHRVRCRDGTYKWILDRGKVVDWTDDGKPLRVIGTHSDISESKKMEKSLAESERQYRLLLENIPDVVYRFSDKRGGLFYSAQAANLFGCPLQKLYDNPMLWNESIHPQDRPLVSHVITDIQSGKVFEVSYRIRTQAGEWRWIWDRSVVISGHGDETIIEGIARDITERKQAEEQLSRILQEQETILETASVGITKIIDRKQVWVNKKVEEIFQYSNEDLVGQTTRKLYLSDEAYEELGKTAYPVLAQGHTYETEQMLKRSDGASIWVKYNGKAIDPSDMSKGTIWILQDVTVRRKTEEALRGSAIYTRSLLEASLDPFVTISPEGKIIDVNRATEDAAGLSRENLIGSDFADYFTDPDRARAGYQLVLEQDSVRDYPLSIRHVSGQTIDVLYNAVIYRNETGEVQGVFAAARDVTERRRAEEALQISEGRLKAIFDIAPIGISITDEKGRIVDRNITSKALLAINRVEHLAENSTGAEWDIFRTDGLPMPPEEFASARALTEDRLISNQILEVRTQQKSVWLMVSAGPLHLPGYGAIIVYADVTERKAAEESVFRMNAELEERVIRRTAQLEAANQELEAFSYSVSHDLRAPLRHIDGYVDLLVSRSRGSLDDKGKHYVDTIAAAARQMGGLIDDLLQFSRTGRSEMRKDNIDMNSLLREAQEILKESYTGRAVEWVVGGLPSVRGDHSLLRQVWINLLANAIKFTATRDAARIEISARQQNGETIFAVADNGVGFDMKHAAKLFGVFQRLHTQEKFEGTGIGLATVQRIVARHGGRIWAEAMLDQGATFYFSLPIEKGDP